MADTKGDTGRADSMMVDTGLVRELAELLNETGLTEIEVEDGGRKIRVSRAALAGPAAPALPTPSAAGLGSPAGQLPAAAPEIAAPDERNILRSPMVGTAYLTPEPGSEPFIRRGDRVKAGDTLLIVEAMKVMNPIAATSDGIIEDILIENAQPVEFDQPLIVLG